jgi:sporulation protein YlmC with PRC-barrel domain
MSISYEEEVKGRTVLDASGRSVGVVDALFLDPDSVAAGLRVSAVRIKLHSEVADAIGVSRGTFHAGVIDVPAAAVQALGDAVILGVDIASLVHHPAGEPVEAH